MGALMMFTISHGYTTTSYDDRVTGVGGVRAQLWGGVPRQLRGITNDRTKSRSHEVTKLRRQGHDQPTALALDSGRDHSDRGHGRRRCRAAGNGAPSGIWLSKSWPCPRRSVWSQMVPSSDAC